MAEEGSDLHEPWAPPRGRPAVPYDIEAETPAEREPSEADTPTEVVPVQPAGPPPLTPPPPPPPPGRKKWPGSAKAVTAVLVVALLGTGAGLGYAWWKTNDDKKNLENVTTEQSQELSAQLDKANAELATTKSSLDAANKQITDLQGQLKTAQDGAAAQKATADALKALFPVNAQTTAASLPGGYNTPALSTVSGGCSVAPCPTAQLALTIESTSGALTISDPSFGRVPLQAGGAGWAATGSVVASLQLQCAGVPQPTTFSLSLEPAAVALDANNATRITTLAGSFVLTSAAVAGVAPAPSCPPGVATYVVTANRT
jgi:hypothetical protein